MPRTGNDDSDVRVHWCRENEKQFIILCHQEFLNGNLLSGSFSNTTMEKIRDRLNAVSLDRASFTVQQCRTKFKNLKRCWKLMYRLRYEGGSGLRWSPTRETIDGPPDAMDRIRQEAPRENPGFLSHGLPLMELCTEIFHHNVAMGEGARSIGTTVGVATEGNIGPGGETATPSPSSRFRDGNNSGSRSSGRSKERSSTPQDDRFQNTLDELTAYLAAKRIKIVKDDEDIETCIQLLDALPDIPRRQYMKAVNLFLKRAAQRIFLALSERDRFGWVMSL